MRLFQFFISALLTAGSLIALADHHAQNPPIVAQVFECTLNKDAAVNDVVAFGKEKVASFVKENDLEMNSYLWEAVAINDPYDEPDVRWVNYYPSWANMYAAQAAFASDGAELVEEFYSMLDCEKPALLASRNLMSDLVIADQKPMVAAVCQLNDGKTPMDAMKFNKQMVDVANDALGTEIGASVFSPAFGVSGVDYVGTFYGKTADMAKLMDSVRDQSLLPKFAAAGLQPVADCVNDLHMSHLMVTQ